eukprot:13135_4
MNAMLWACRCCWISSIPTLLKMSSTASTSSTGQIRITSTLALLETTRSGTHVSSITASGRFDSCFQTARGGSKNSSSMVSGSTASRQFSTSITASASASSTDTVTTSGWMWTWMPVFTSCSPTTSYTASGPVPSQLPRTSQACLLLVGPCTKEVSALITVSLWQRRTCGSSCRSSGMISGRWATSCTCSPTGAIRRRSSAMLSRMTRRWWEIRLLPSGSWTRRCTQACRCLQRIWTGELRCTRSVWQCRVE